ncbi:ThiF family adenylyltransferase [Sediminibacterium sp. TEGAF015]|uniref:ThiF family adenylyltransferase n=1 Tax=Sediminibacterium sp. TEGAF015 TaxID=575378 RepID=UPI0021FB3E8F|nr:ThiF family adenylyltransferase [Sediminibacterium sp. TEGAF015]BDQ11999.1 molybdenum cofactor biosynthesis protein MoeB [Sediminibacterium sp. TEGAF015]
MTDFNRYKRQMILPGFGADTQQKLAEAKVLIVGMGGLGCPVLQYLAGAGVGTIGIMDADQVSLSNLHRQLLYDESDIGQLKVIAAAQKIKKLNAGIQIVEYSYRLTKENAFSIIGLYDWIVDATDNFGAKYLINDVCVLLNKTWIYGAVTGYEGQVAVLNNRQMPGPVHYRHLFPVQPLPNEFASCEETGVIGVLPGIIGTMQAAEAIKLITGLGGTIKQSLHNYHYLSGRWYEIALTANPNSPIIDESFFHKTNYETACMNEADELEDIDINEIDVRQLLDIQKQPGHFILDVRELHEYPRVDFVHAQIPMSVLKESLDQLPQQPIYIICHQGIRSVYAAQYIKLHKGVETYSIKGGLTAYFNAVNNE